MAKWVLLRHELPPPDSSWHLDWMFEAAPPGNGLVTFRIAPGAGRPDDPECRSFTGERIGRHRADYLTYEGPVSGGRGVVTREGSGTARLRRVDSDRIEIELAGTDGHGRLWVGMPKPGSPTASSWMFRLSTGR